MRELYQAGSIAGADGQLFVDASNERGTTALEWLLPASLGDIQVSAHSGVLRFEVGVPVSCVFDAIETRVSGVAVDPIELHPGLHIVHLHVFDLFKDSILYGELRLEAGTVVKSIPFKISVGELAADTFEHTQFFSDEEKYKWGVEESAVLAAIWSEECNKVVAKIETLKKSVVQQPHTRSGILFLERELDASLQHLNKRREELRPRKSALREPDGFAMAVHGMRLTLRKAHLDHAAISNQVEAIKKLVAIGHIRQAEIAATRLPALNNYGDIDLEFLHCAKTKLLKRRKIIIGVAVFVSVLIFALILKLTLIRQ